jgi:hypothetical protein
MLQTINRICELQKSYSSTNTPEMQERGRLIRAELAGEMRNRLSHFKGFMDPVFSDLAVDASDGIGRKTEAPWVRVYSKDMSPTPRDGYYLVMHFAADGSAFFVTLGCGGTVWRGGDLSPISDRELEARTSWARRVISDRWGGLKPFEDLIDLGAKRALPKTFEKATVVARRFSVGSVSSVELDKSLDDAAERLNEIYVAQVARRDLSPGEQDVEEIGRILKPHRAIRRAQGRGLSASERMAVEQHAMSLVKRSLVAEGFDCEDVSKNESFDILAQRGSLRIKVEVKGTTSDFCDSVVMTRNEVNLHRSEKGRTTLALVSRIVLTRGDDHSVASGGEVEILHGWDIDDWATEAIAFQVRRSVR